MPFANAATKTAALALAVALSQPAVAQPLSPAPIPAPPAWTVSPDAARGIVQIGSIAKGSVAQFVGGCSKLAAPGFVGTFSRYRGYGLRTDGGIERVLFYVRGEDWQEAFSAQLRYSRSSGSWEIVEPLAPVFVNSFSRGATLAILNSSHEEVFSFDLTGSTAAARTMRNVCGFP
jgi:hypothetical protein